MNVNVDQDDDEDDDQLNFVFLDSRSACGFIYGILNHPILGDQRLLIINKFWDTVCELAKDFASAAINGKRYLSLIFPIHLLIDSFSRR